MNGWVDMVQSSFRLSVTLVSGLVLIGLGIPLYFFWPKLFAAAYLVAVLTAVQIVVGCVLMLFVHALTGGHWGKGTLRILASGAGSAPWVALLFVPVLIWTWTLYPWAQTGWQTEHESKRIWFQPGFFIARSVIYWALLLWLVSVARATVFVSDRSHFGRAGVGLVVLTWLGTYMSYDWVLGVNPEWHSSVFGPLFLSGAYGLAWSFMLMFGLAGSRRDSVVPLLHGNLLLTAVSVWAYLSFSQLIVIWMGHIPARWEWYRERLDGPWAYAMGAVWCLHFALPFLCLLFRFMKRRPAYLFGLSALVFFGSWMDTLLWIMPVFAKGPAAFLLALVAGGGVLFLWFAGTLWAGQEARA